MVDVTIELDRVRLAVVGWDKLWSFRNQLEFPLDHVTSIRHDSSPALGWWHGVRVLGTNLPGVLTAGTFYQQDGVVFYDVHDPERTIVLELDHEHYRRLVIEVADPAATVALVQRALDERGQSGPGQP